MNENNTLSFLNSITERENAFRTLLEAVENGKTPVACSGVSAVHKALVCAALCEKTGFSLVAVTETEAAAEQLAEDLKKLGTPALTFPAKDLELSGSVALSKEYEHKRIDTLSALADGDFGVLCVSVEAAIQFTVPKADLVHNSFTLCPGDTVNLTALCTRLDEAGYVRADMVEGKGQYAVRGGILDLFSADVAVPCRIELWGDEIDNISYFDPETQRRTDMLDRLQVTQAAETVCERERLSKIITDDIDSHKKLSENRVKRLENDRTILENGGSFPLDRYLPLVYSHPETVFDYAADALVVLCESGNITERLKNLSWQNGEDIKTLLEQGFVSKGCDTFCLTEQEFILKTENAVILDNFARSRYETPPKELVAFSGKRSSPWNGDLGVLCEDVDYFLSAGGSVVLLAGEEKAAKILDEDLCGRNVPSVFVPAPSLPLASGVTVTVGALSGGFEWPENKFMLVTRRTATVSTKKTRAVKKQNSIGSLDELHVGDAVVHAAHGIGIFGGINSITTAGVTKDYIKIRYAGQDVLYVPVTQLDLVSRYIGADSDSVHLHKLGGTEWAKTRTRVRKAVRDMAKELTALYAKRMAVKGYAFCADTDLQNDFERRFPYEETDDQLRCVREIKSDMERAVPMDRLLCGDVGFGKTEVALRAAFKCICEGKQCAILVPTTILAWQHYNTAKERIGDLPVTVELLSRFVTPKRQQRITRDLAAGAVDLVIGTHRLISKDVRFKDLGLVIIDEEQRFGVAQKEKLKERYPTVDALTLSATPIPRTLNMAMTGLRDMSSIDEAPGDRHPVQTYVLEQNNGVLYDAMRKELRRGGQVYYLHNRVESITKVAARIKIVLPEANVGVAHGKMDEEELSDIWKKLIEHEIDILVCTTIIETGVDVPNVNTLIIEDADRMGLSQLHQLRGRVGRSARRAYAYFCFRGEKSLNEDAAKRLEAIRQFTEFGSGFKIAMRDLEIRGAGSVLGGAQHGNMEAVGYDMYLKLLSEAMENTETEEIRDEPVCTVDLAVNAHIPPAYISSLPARLGIYKRIADIRSENDSEDVIDELCDRFGEPPATVMGLIEIALLRNKAAKQGIYEVVRQNDTLALHCTAAGGELFVKLSAVFGDRFRMNREGTELTVRLKKGQKLSDAISEIVSVL